MAVFNSLGSNYNLSFVLRTYLKPSVNPAKKLQSRLEERYHGKASLFYKGRNAITAALELADLPVESEVLINGYSCLAVWQAVKKAGLKPVLIDPPKDGLDFTENELKDAFKKNTKARAVIIQYTLGFAQDIKSISKFCQINNLILIEDLAHSAGAKYIDNQEVGLSGDFAVLSFSQDKIIDGVSGGALIDRRANAATAANSYSSISFSQKLRDYSYPFFTWLIRSTYNFYIGKILHKILRSSRLLTSPMALKLDKKYYKLPHFEAKLALYELNFLNQNIIERRNKTKYYLSLLPANLTQKYIKDTVENSSCLRLPILLPPEKVADILSALAKNGIHLSDRWFDAPIAPAKYKSLSDYQTGSCPQAEIYSKKIINLPTHKNVSQKQIKTVCEVIKSCL